MKRKQVLLLRLSKDGNRGILLIDGEMVCVTLEDDWNENQKNISCIPAGRYTLKRVESAKFGWTYTVIGCQPERDLIRFHGASTQDDVEGCVGVGMIWARVKRRPGIAEAKRARTRFMAAMEGVDEADFIIREIYDDAIF